MSREKLLPAPRSVIFRVLTRASALTAGRLASPAASLCRVGAEHQQHNLGGLGGCLEEGSVKPLPGRVVM